MSIITKLEQAKKDLVGIDIDMKRCTKGVSVKFSVSDTCYVRVYAGIFNDGPIILGCIGEQDTDKETILYSNCLSIDGSVELSDVIDSIINVFIDAKQDIAIQGDNTEPVFKKSRTAFQVRTPEMETIRNQPGFVPPKVTPLSDAQLSADEKFFRSRFPGDKESDDMSMENIVNVFQAMGENAPALNIEPWDKHKKDVPVPPHKPAVRTIKDYYTTPKELKCTLGAIALGAVIITIWYMFK